MIDLPPPIGGVYKTTPEDFVVHEVMRPPPPDPTGAWLWLHVRRRDLTTDEVIRRLAAAWEVPAEDVRRSGRKDRRAVCSQWLAIRTPRDEAPWPEDLTCLARLRAADPPHLGMHEANEFRLLLRGAADDEPLLQAWASRLLSDGAPNRFGPQRYGVHGENATRGGDLLAGRPVPPADRGLRKLWLHAWQAARFDEVLDLWLAEGRPEEPGDLVWHSAAGLALPRGRAGGISTGPLFGARMDWPRGASQKREAAVLEAAGWQRDAFTDAAERLRLWGGRRPLWVVPTVCELRRLEPGVVECRLQLPPGAYATTVLNLFGARPADGDETPAPDV